MYEYVGSISGSGQWCDVLEPPIRVQLAGVLLLAPARSVSIHRGRLGAGGRWGLHSSLPPRNYPYQSTWSVSAVLRDTHWALINSGASVNNRWNEPRYVDVDIPDIYFQKQSQALCMKRIFNNNIFLMALEYWNILIDNCYSSHLLTLMISKSDGDITTASTWTWSVRRVLAPMERQVTSSPSHPPRDCSTPHSTLLVSSRSLVSWSPCSRNL